MATIDVGVRLNLVDASLRNIAAQVRRTVENISPQLNVDINDEAIRRFLTQGIRRLPTIQVSARLSNDAKAALNASVKEVIERQTVRQIGFAPGILNRLQSQLDNALQVQVEARLAVREARREERGFRSPETASADQRRRLAEATEQAQRESLAAEQKVADVLEEIVRAKEAQRAFENQLIARRQRELAEQQGIQRNLVEVRQAVRQRVRDEQRLAAQVRQNLAESRLPSQEDLEARLPTISIDLTPFQQLSNIAAERARLQRDDAALEGQTNRRLFDAINQRAEQLRQQVAAGGGGTFEQRLEAERVRLAREAAQRQGEALQALTQNLRAQQIQVGIENGITQLERQEGQVVRDTVAERARRLRQIRAAPDFDIIEEFTRPADIEPTQRREQELNQNVIQALGEKLAAENRNVELSRNELIARGIINQELQNVVLAEQKKRQTAEQDVREEEQAILKEEIQELRRRNQIEARSTGFARTGEAARRDLNEILRERVQQAQRREILPGAEESPLEILRGGAVILNRDLLEAGRIVRGSAEQVRAALRTRQIRQRLQGAASRLLRLEDAARDVAQDLQSIDIRAGALSSIGAAEGAELTSQQVELIKQQNQIEEQIISARRAQQRFEAQLLQARQEELRVARQRTRTVTPRGQGGGDTVTFRGAGDIEAFGSRLGTQQLDRFVKALTATSKVGENVTRVFDRFSRTSREATGLTSVLERRITSATRAAFEFGRQVRFAAERLLAWATPAAFLFRAIGLLQEAVQVITRLDTQAARLEFFREGGLLEQIAGRTATLTDAINRSAQNIRLFTEVAQAAGIQVDAVAEAFVTLARVGIDVFSGATADAERATAALNNQLLRTITTIVRLEQGSINAETAVRGFVAVQRQFQGALRGLNQELEQSAIANIAAQIADASRRTSFNIAELTDATTRLGAAFAQLEGVNTAAVLELIGTSARVTGASSSRLGTAFRQLITLAQRNEEALKSFGIQIRDVDEATGRLGQVTFERLLGALERFADLARTSPAQAESLARLLADRRNVSDFKALAVAVADNTGEFKALATTQGEAARVADQVQRLFLQEAVQAETLEGRLNTLRETFNRFAQALGTSDAFRVITDLAQSFLEVITEVTEGVRNIEPLLAGLAGVAVARLGPQVGAAVGGAIAGTIDTIVGRGLREQVTGLLDQTRTKVEGINLAEKEGLLTQQQANTLRQRTLAIVQQQATLQVELDALIAQEQVLTQRNALTEERQLQIELERAAVQARINALTAQEAGLQTDVTAQLSARNAFIRSNFGAALAGIALAGATFFGDTLGEAIGGTDETLAAGVKGAFQGAGLGAIIGAQIGSIIPVVGTAIGAAAGALVGGIGGAVRAVGAEEEKLDNERSRREEAQTRRNQAFEAQLAIIAARERRQNALLADRTQTQKRVIEAQQEIARLTLDVQRAEAGTTEQKEAQQRVISAQIGLEALRTKEANEGLQIEARKVVLARELLRIRLNEQRETERLNLLQEIAIQDQTRGRQVELEIIFDRDKVARQIDSIRREIELQEQELQNIDITVDRQAREQIERRLLELREREIRLRLGLERQTIRQRREVLQVASRETQKQVDAWEKAAKTVTDAFKEVVNLQRGLAGIIQEAGDLTSSIIASRAEEVRTQLEARGASIETRLTVLRRETARQLSALERSGEFARAALQGGEIEAFSTAREINTAVEGLISTIRDAAQRATDREFVEETQAFDLELTLLRERERRERAVFDLRIQQTRNEIGIRRELINNEIELFRTRLSAEQELINLRADQQKKFGQIVLEGPEKLNEVVESIAASEDFFRGIAELDSEGLKQIFQRARGALARGQTEALQRVVTGLENRISLGGPDIVARIDNEALRDVLLRALDPRVTARSLERQLQAEQRILDGQLSEQKAIRERQQELLRLSGQDEALQRAQLRVAQTITDVAERQRDQLINVATRQLAIQRGTQLDLRNAIQNARIFAAGGGEPIPVAAAPGGPVAPAGQPIQPQARVGLPPGINFEDQERNANTRNNSLIKTLIDCCRGLGGAIGAVRVGAETDTIRLTNVIEGASDRNAERVSSRIEGLRIGGAGPGGLSAAEIAAVARLVPAPQDDPGRAFGAAARVGGTFESAILQDIARVNERLLQEQIRAIEVQAQEGQDITAEIQRLRDESANRLLAIENANLDNPVLQEGLDQLADAFEEGRARGRAAGDPVGAIGPDLVSAFREFLGTVDETAQRAAAREAANTRRAVQRAEARNRLLRQAVEEFNRQVTQLETRRVRPLPQVGAGFNLPTIEELDQEQKKTIERLQELQDQAGSLAFAFTEGEDAQARRLEETAALRGILQTIQETRRQIQSAADIRERIRNEDARAGRLTNSRFRARVAELRNALEQQTRQIREQFPELEKFVTQTRGVNNEFNAVRQIAKELGIELKKAGENAGVAAREFADFIPGLRDIAPRFAQTVDEIAERLTQRRGGRVTVTGEETRRLQQQLALQQQRGFGATPGQQRRLDRLQEQDLRRSRRQRSSRQISRNLLGDPAVFGEFVQAFRDLQNRQNPFFDTLRDITGARERRRGGGVSVRGRAARELDPDAVARLLTDAGLTSLAETITGRETATDVANLIFTAFRNLNNTTKDGQEQLRKALEKILEVEIERGRREQRDRAPGRPALGVPLFQEGAPAAEQLFRRQQQERQAMENAAAKLAEAGQNVAENTERLSEAISASSVALLGVFEEGANRLETLRVNTQNDVQFDIKFDTTGAPTPEQFSTLFIDQLNRSGLALPQEVIDIIVKSIIQNSDELFKRGLIGIPIIKKLEKPDRSS